MQSTHVFSHMTGSVPQAIDEVNPVTGKSAIEGETLEQVQKRYPGAIVETWKTYIDRKEAALVEPPVEISEDKYTEMLEVLPPVNWVQRNGTSTFKMSECLSGRITSIYCCIGHRFFTLTDKISLPHDEIVERCRKVVV